MPLFPALRDCAACHERYPQSYAQSASYGWLPHGIDFRCRLALIWNVLAECVGRLGPIRQPCLVTPL